MITKWYNTNFDSSSETTMQFKQFAGDFKRHIKKITKDITNGIEFIPGHFYISGFLKLKNDKIIYFSIPDVRYEKDGWNRGILIRTAKDFKDYTGGSNYYTSLENFINDIKGLGGISND